MYDALRQVKNKMANCHLGDLSLWKIADCQQASLLVPGTALSRLDLVAGAVTRVMELLEPIFKEQEVRFLQQRKEFTAIGTLPQQRADLELKFNAVTRKLPTRNGAEINVFWLPASHRFRQQGCPNEVSAPCTMIFCNPNMGFAEMQ